MERCTAHAKSVKTCVFLAVSRSSRREAHGERTSPTFGGFFQSATLSCVETEDGEEEEAMIYKGASLLRAIGQLEGRIGKRGSSYLQNFTVGIAQPRCDLAAEL